MNTPRARLASLLTALVTAATLAACAAPDEQGDDRLRVYATTGYLADLVSNLAPDAEVTTMVGPGGDPHTYQPSTRDIQRIEDADVVLWNGLHLEAQMSDLLASLGDRQVAVGDHVPDDLLRELPTGSANGTPLHDPHIWNDPQIWQIVTATVADQLADARPEHADDYRSRAEDYSARVRAADLRIRAQFDSIPADSRVLITGHDAFGYYHRAYGLEVHATDFISSQAAISPAELSELAGLIADRRLPAIFADNQANPQAITSLQEAVAARGFRVHIAAEPLYADSLGAEASVDTYLDVIEHNARAITAELGGEIDPSAAAEAPAAEAAAPHTTDATASPTAEAAPSSTPVQEGTP